MKKWKIIVGLGVMISLIFLVGYKNTEDEEISTNLFIGCGRDIYNPDWVGAEYKYQLGEWCETCGYCSDYDFGCWRDDKIALDWSENNLGERSPTYFCWNSKDVILKTINCYGKPAIIAVNNSDEFIAVNPILCDSDSKGCREAGFSAIHTNNSCRVTYWKVTENSIEEIKKG